MDNSVLNVSGPASIPSDTYVNLWWLHEIWSKLFHWSNTQAVVLQTTLHCHTASSQSVQTSFYNIFICRLFKLQRFQLVTTDRKHVLHDLILLKQPLTPTSYHCLQQPLTTTSYHCLQQPHNYNQHRPRHNLEPSSKSGNLRECSFVQRTLFLDCY